MSDTEVKFLDITVDISDTTSGALHILEILRPDWKKAEIELEVRKQNIQVIILDSI